MPYEKSGKFRIFVGDMDTRERKIYRVTLIGTAVNALLIILKFLAGIFGRSSAMVADAAHSLSDFITDAIVLIFVKIAGKPKDDTHEYGHGKYETMATVVIGLILIIAGALLLANGVDHIVRSLHGEEIPRPGMIALIIAVVSIISKEWLFHYTRRVGKATNSPAVMANAWHHRSDAISSGGTLIGIAGAIFLDWRILDPIAASVVSVFIIKSGYDIMRPMVGELLEAALPESQKQEIVDIVKSVPEIRNVHNLRTRRIGNNIAIDLHAKMNGHLSLAHAHELATKAENALKEKYGKATIVNIHMEPLSDRDD